MLGSISSLTTTESPFLFEVNNECTDSESPVLALSVGG